MKKKIFPCHITFRKVAETGGNRRKPQISAYFQFDPLALIFIKKKCHKNGTKLINRRQFLAQQRMRYYEVLFYKEFVTEIFKIPYKLELWQLLLFSHGNLTDVI